LETTWGAVTIVACPAQHVEAVLDVLEEFGLRPEFGGPGAADRPLEELILGEAYVDAEMTCGNSGVIAEDLAELTGVAAKLSEAPTAEFLGELHYVLPDGSLFAGDGDADANAVVTAPAWTVMRRHCVEESVRIAWALETEGWPAGLAGSNRVVAALCELVSVLCELVSVLDGAFGVRFALAYEALRRSLPEDLESRTLRRPVPGAEELRRRLEELRRRLDAQGGRGVDLAEEIDALAAAIDSREGDESVAD
jgi:hypothetical protein